MSNDFFGFSPENVPEENAEFIAKLAEITEKNITEAFGPPVMSNKEAINHYIDYCQMRLEKSPINSADYLYYKAEIAKSRLELNCL
jgi:hypothetical protein